jgi:S1-C subfamily serine protease
MRFFLAVVGFFVWGLFVWGLLVWFPAAAQGVETRHLFSRHQDRIVQVRILEASSGSKAGVGSGFVVTASGLIVTNYHVIADLVHHPEQYRGEILTVGGRLAPLRLVNFDVVHDLALVATDLEFPGALKLVTTPLGVGERLYAIGTPLDLGFTIVEGTYNGLLEYSLYEKIHFTGSINPGMSGGPALLADGRVAGVNVATAGEQVSFLVPARYVAELVARTRSLKPLEREAALALLKSQLLANQAQYMERLLAAKLSTMPLNGYRVPGHIAAFVRCWGDAGRDPAKVYDLVTQQCSSEDDIYLSRSQQTGFIHFQHEFLSGRRINRFRFYNLYQERFNAPYEKIHADRGDVSRFACHTDFVRHGGLDFKAVLCLRRYKRLPGLYDAVLRAATLDANTHGVITTLVLAGVSADNARRFARHYLESFAVEKAR